MILQSLLKYYEALAEKGMISKPGWVKQKVSYALEINPKGELTAYYPLLVEVERGKKKMMVPREMEVPAGFVRSSGITSNFLCDNAKYMLGVDIKKPQRGPLCFLAAKERHQSILGAVDSPAAKAICSFFDTFDPRYAQSTPCLADAPDDFWESANLVWMVDGAFAHECPQIRQAWDHFYSDSSDSSDSAASGEESVPVAMRCLLTGDTVEPLKTHTPIKGIPGAQSTGAALISFNAPAFCSYDREQNLNAPIGKYGAFAYTTALNHLISDKSHNKLFGDTLLLYWADDAESAYQNLFEEIFDPNPDSMTDRELNDLMGKIVSGRTFDWQDIPLNPSNHFNILGISPNAARLSVRFFYQDSFGNIVRHLKEHYDRLAIVPDARKLPEMLPLWRILKETVNPKGQDKSASPQLAGDMLRAILTGGRYPATVYQQIRLRIRADREINHERAAMIKAYLLKNMCTAQNKEALTMDLNESTTYQPYVLGRLFAVLEKIQEQASGVTTIKDKYFTSAGSTPSAVFPLIVDLAQKHLRKMDGGKKVYFEKLLQSLLCMVSASYPSHHTLSDQGVFQLGYYHQKQKFYQSKTTADAENNQNQ